MQTPTNKTPYARCKRLARHLLRMLDKFPGRDNLRLAKQKVEAARDEWQAARSACDDATEALDDTRTDMGFAEHTVDQFIRKLKKGIGTADGGARGGLLEKQVFPNGLDDEVRVRGQAQADALRNLGERLKVVIPDWPEAERWLAELKQQYAMYQQALNARTAAEQVVTQCLIRSNGARERFVTAYIEASKLVGAEFPRSKKTQEMFFGKVRTSRRKDDSAADGDDTDEDEDDDGDDTPIN